MLLASTIVPSVPLQGPDRECAWVTLAVNSIDLWKVVAFHLFCICSPGPLAVGNTVIGAVSWGIACAQGFPDVYARISSHRAWITSVSGV